RSENIFVQNKNIKLDYGLSKNKLKGQIVRYQHLRFYKKSDVYNVGFLMQEICHNIQFTENIVSPIEKYIKIYEDRFFDEFILHDVLWHFDNRFL
ncbi:6527_t:CDS:1, partial [Dentiscutata erythropus]